MQPDSSPVRLELRDPVVYDASSGHLFRQMCGNVGVSDYIMAGKSPSDDGGGKKILT